MAFLEPILGPVLDFLPFGGPDNPPIYTTLPKTLKAFENKYTDPEFSSYFANLPPNVQRPLMEMDRQRVLRGQQPYSKEQFVRAGQTSVRGEAYTKPQDRKITNPFGNFLSDLRQLTTSIPRIPSALFQEFEDLQNFGEEAGKADELAEMLQLPGIRLLPGTYTASNLLSGKEGIEEALTHPLFTTLDVLPAVKPGVKALAKTPKGMAAIETGQKVSSAFKRTMPGKFINEAFGKEARDLSRLFENQNTYIREVLNPESKIVTDKMIENDHIAKAARASTKLKRDFPSISQERFDAITEQARLDRSQLVLNDVEQAMMNRYDDIQRIYTEEAIERGWLEEFDGELYDKNTAKKLLKGKISPEQAVPARFRPELRRRLEEQIKLSYATPENTAKVTEALSKGNYREIPGFDKAQVAQWTDELNQTWMDMRASGVNPMFVQQVRPGMEAAIRYPRVLERLQKPSQVLQQIRDVTPSGNDLTVGLTHQGLEFLTRQGSELYADAITNSFANKTYAQIADELGPVAAKRARRSGRTYESELEALVNKHYSVYNPDKLFNFTKVKVAPLADGEVRMIPKSVEANIKRLSEPARNGVTATLDPVMGVFRTAVLPLSPRWHLNNIVGGGMALLLEDPAAFKFGKNATELLRKGETTIDGKLFKLEDMPDDFKLSLGGSSRYQQELNFRAGNTLGRVMGEVNAARMAGKVSGVRNAAKGVIDKSFEWNAHIDDWYRAVAYLKGSDDILKKGLSRAEAEAAGVALTRKVMQMWNDITPIERSVLRYVFPFYNFTRFITKYALRYPVDHPFRAAVIGSIARNELEDLGTTLPEKFLNNFFLGEPDKNGNVKTVQMGGMNPFANVANYFTLTGMLGQTNPIFQTVAEQFGINTQTGQPELFPDLGYDAETGRLMARGGNPVMGLLANTIPQSQVLLGLTQSSSEFKDMFQRNPDAAMALLRSNIGLPVLFRDINVPQEQAKAETARHDAAVEAYNNALRSGNDAEANRYANVRPLLEQIRTLQGEGQLEQYTTNIPGIDTLEVAQEVLIRANAP